MSEFSPDAIQFKKTTATPESPAPQNPRLQQLEAWLQTAPEGLHQRWITQRIQQEKHKDYAAQLHPLSSLSQLQEQLRTLRLQVPAQEEPLLALINHWLKQTEALHLKNISAYEKTLSERPLLQQALTAFELSPCFITRAQQVDAFLATRAARQFPRQVSPPSPLPQQNLAPPEGSILLKPDHPELSNGLPLRIYQRSAKAWLRRAMRYFQLAQRADFSQPDPINKCVKSLFACLTLEPKNRKALLLLGWLEACANQPQQAFAYLERLRQGEHEPEMIFLIRFLQNRPLL